MGCFVIFYALVEESRSKPFRSFRNENTSIRATMHWAKPVKLRMSGSLISVLSTLFRRTSRIWLLHPPVQTIPLLPVMVAVPALKANSTMAVLAVTLARLDFRVGAPWRKQATYNAELASMIRRVSTIQQRGGTIPAWALLLIAMVFPSADSYQNPPNCVLCLFFLLADSIVVLKESRRYGLSRLWCDFESFQACDGILQSRSNQERSDCQSQLRFRFKEKEKGSESGRPGSILRPSRHLSPGPRGQTLILKRRGVPNKKNEWIEPRLTGWPLGDLTSIIFGIANHSHDYLWVLFLQSPYRFPVSDNFVAWNPVYQRIAYIVCLSISLWSPLFWPPY